jgi:hypothetical protein
VIGWIDGGVGRERRGRRTASKNSLLKTRDMMMMMMDIPSDRG